MKIIIKLVFISSLFLTMNVSVAFAQNLGGVYMLVRDSDGTVPKSAAKITITFEGKTKGLVFMLAIQPGETVDDSGKYSVNGSLITIHFNEMEWEANNQQFQFDGCTLILPFKALGGSPGLGTSVWLKKDPKCDKKSDYTNTDKPVVNNSEADSTQVAQGKSKETSENNNTNQQKNEQPITKESCEQCKYIKCIKSYIKLREAYIKEFQNAAKEKKWGNIEKEGEDFFDLGTLITPEAKKSAADEFNEQRIDFWNEFKTKIDKRLVEEMKKHCQMKVTGDLTAQTDPVRCETNQDSMKAAEKAVPCKELYKSSEIHESYHVTRCMERAEKLKENKGPFIPTVRGEVKEEMEAYKQQISILKVLLENITKTKNGCWRCGKTQEVYSDKKECNINCPGVKLGGAVVFKCFKLNTKDGEHIMKIGDQF